jgi:hypothetical protein
MNNFRNYLEYIAQKEFELRETRICTKPCCTPEILEIEERIQKSIIKQEEMRKPLTRKRK